MQLKRKKPVRWRTLKQLEGRFLKLRLVLIQVSLTEFYSSHFPGKYLHCFNSEAQSVSSAQRLMNKASELRAS